MALTKCKECGAEISRKAKACPQCGAPRKKKISIFTWIVLIIFIGVIAKFIIPDKPKTTTTPISSKKVVHAEVKWYENGTLHKTSVAEWNSATYANKLATAADMAMANPQIKEKVMSSGSIDTLRPFAVQLVICIDEAAAGQGYGNTGVAQLAAGCMILMG